MGPVARGPVGVKGGFFERRTHKNVCGLTEMIPCRVLRLIMEDGRGEGETEGSLRT